MSTLERKYVTVKLIRANKAGTSAFLSAAVGHFIYLKLKNLLKLRLTPVHWPLLVRERRDGMVRVAVLLLLFCRLHLSPASELLLI